jgi:Ca2+-binding RTX toxin-like protein
MVLAEPGFAALRPGVSEGNITGTDGDDVLIGTGDADIMKGKGGFDIVHGLDGNDKVQGGDGDDAVYGDKGNDKVWGEAGNDYVVGGLGDDTIDGGDGLDRAGFFDAAAGAHVSLLLQGTAQDTGMGMDVLLNVENLSGSLHNDLLIGDEQDNWLWGSTEGDDTLVGNGGDDLLNAGLGDHRLQGGSGVDTVKIDDNSQGVFPNGVTLDLGVQAVAQDSGLGMMTLTGIENLSGTTLGDTLIGSSKANVLAGADDSDALSGGGGRDALYGDGFVDAPSVSGTSGSITFTPWADENEFFSGGDDTLDGGVGADTLVGGIGQDQLTGGTGAVIFAFYALKDSELDRHDVITDLTKVDIIDLALIDADTTVDGDQAFTLVKKFTGAAGELRVRYDAAEEVTHIMLDVDGDKEADSVIDAVGKVKFDHFVL